MLTRIRARFTYANLAVTLALVFAMTGGAYAANKYLITSTKQISPKVLKALKGAAGKPGAAGPAGAQGPQGGPGPQGAPGAKGENGANGANGASGTNGVSVTGVAASKGECENGGVKYTSASGSTAVCNGKNGTTGFTATLPSEKTETGTVSASYNAGAAAEEVYASVSFPIPLAEPVAAHFVASPTTECPGNIGSPEAKPGNLCVYGFGSNLTFSTFLNLENIKAPTETGKFGVLVVFSTEASGTAFAAGSWAVTAK
jgi:hypothetical protein